MSKVDSPESRDKKTNANDLESGAKETILCLISELSECVFTEPEERQDLTSVEFFFKRMNTRDILAALCDKFLPHENKIRERDITFFQDNRQIFAGLPEVRVNYYIKRIVEDKVLKKEDEEAIWQYFDILLQIARKHMKTK